MKRLASIVVALAIAVVANAVLKESDLSTTLSVLRAELESTYSEQKANIERYTKTTNSQHEQMVELMQKSDQISLMLYSQKQDFTFDLAYACHEATELYKEFSRGRMPYDKILANLNTEIARYEALIAALKNIPPSIRDTEDTEELPDSLKPKALPKEMVQELAAEAKEDTAKSQPFILTEAEQAERQKCLTYAEGLLNDMIALRESIERDAEHYTLTAEKLKTLNDYALERYVAIQNNIFVNGDANYFSVLASLSRYIGDAKADVSEKYDEGRVKTASGQSRPVHSQWRGPIVMGLTIFVLIYVVIAALLSNVIVRWIVPKRFRTEEFMKKKVCLILAAAMIIFGISLMVARCFIQHNFLLMASKLLIEFAWLLAAIFVSLLIRLPGSQIRSGFAIYAPMMIMSFLVITFRIVFIPNNLVQIIFPPVLLLFTLWQWRAVAKNNKNIPKSDIFYTWISLLLMVVSTIVAWNGYTLMSVQMLIWWMFQLTCIQTITCIYDLLSMYEGRVMAVKLGNEKRKRGSDSMMKMMRSRNAEHIDKTWAYDFVTMALVPVLAVFSVLLSIWWAADVFDLTETVSRIFMVIFLNIPDVVQLSLMKLVLVLSLFFIFRYINYLIRSLYQKFHKSKVVVNGQPNFTLAKNIIAICVWGTYFVIAIQTLKIPSTAISVISAGLATGVGFAMKDLLENFFYGISLMAGRVRVGDYIECDGIRGKVDSITYQSTQILTADGCVIAFLNSSLFSKNFKNITKNHSYELVKVPVGVAYGTDVDKVREIIVEAVKGLITKKNGREVIDSKKPIGVILDEFGDNSVNLYVTYWALVEEKLAITAKVKETVYNTLNENDIEIPFPQRDLHIRSGELKISK